MEFNSMSEKDLEHVSRLYAEAFNREPWSEKWTAEMAYKRLSGFLSNPMSIGYVVREGDEIISCLIGYECSFLNVPEFHVEEFFVTESVQGKGYGSIILEHVGKELKAKGVECITLMTKRGFPSERFYGKQGFQTIDSLTFMYKNI